MLLSELERIKKERMTKVTKENMETYIRLRKRYTKLRDNDEVKEENKEIANLMRTMFAEWIGNGHNNFDDVNTCILRIELTHGLLLSHGTRYDIDFSK